MSTTPFGRICIATLIASPAVVHALNTWPNPFLDELDSQLYDRQGYNGRNLPVGMLFGQDCSSFLFGPNAGRANAADWLRTAYHDMATHNTMDGTGGLDASIRFQAEQERPEAPFQNAGDGFQNTFAFIAGLSNRYFSLADNIALAAVTAVELCGGPKIPFRGGRVDAIEPNTPGVPEPQQSLEEHVSSFSRQGFTQEEMIGLIACGHTFGGVQHVAFPDIVPPSDDPQNTSGNSRFDTTFTHFDNRIDNNVTMSKFANPDVFRSTCANLLARMIDTVPGGVALTNVLEPIKFKPVAVSLVWVGGGNIKLRGEVRVWNSAPSEITMKWKARDGSSSPSFSAPLVQNTDHTTDPLIPDSPTITNRWYEFPDVLHNSTQSVSEFWFEVKNDDGSNKVENLGGVGYHLQDVVMITNNTCVGIDDGSLVLTVEAAIRADLGQPSRVYVKADETDQTGRPNLKIVDITAPLNRPTIAGYTLWGATFGLNATGAFYTVAVDIDGQTYETNWSAGSLDLNPVLLNSC
ncbi:putative L-ascorbate oxidase [Cristinia sonorae]|uniref:Peroxidase n=1 Tax=Cristinia sonorae TaxID=1940300 RepID=A0A8K0UR59_9AGAR|nr:putative L-ascorbate oxidase [Cristinia sonorae]